MVPYAEFSNKHLLQKDGRIDTSSSVEQPGASGLQMARFSAWGFYRRIIHHRAQPLSLFFISFTSCIPTQGEYAKEIETMTSS